MSDYASIVREFIIENFLFGNENGLKNDSSFLDDGIMDSTGALEMITFLEERFEISVEDEEFTVENFDSIDRVASYLKAKLG